MANLTNLWKLEVNRAYSTNTAQEHFDSVSYCVMVEMHE